MSRPTTPNETPIKQEQQQVVTTSAVAPPIPLTQQQEHELGIQNVPSPRRPHTSSVATKAISPSRRPSTPPPSQPPGKSRPVSPAASAAGQQKQRRGAIVDNNNNNNNDDDDVAVTQPKPSQSNSISSAFSVPQLQQSQSQFYTSHQAGRPSTTPTKKAVAPPTPPRTRTDSKISGSTTPNRGKVVPPPPNLSTGAVRRLVADSNRRQHEEQQQQQQQQQVPSTENPNRPSPVARHKSQPQPSQQKPRAVDPKVLPPAPSFEHERLALLRHLKEIPKQVSHSTSTDFQLTQEEYDQFEVNQEDSVMSSTLSNVNNNNNNNNNNVNNHKITNQPVSTEDGFHVSTPPPQKTKSSQQQQQQRTRSNSNDPYVAAYAEALQAKEKVADDRENRALDRQSAGKAIEAKRQQLSAPNAMDAVAFSGPTPLQQQCQQQIRKVETYLVLRDLEVEELTFRSQLSEHSVQFLDEVRFDFWKFLFCLLKENPQNSSRGAAPELVVSDQSVQSLVLALEEAQNQSAHAADRLQETYDVLDRMANELADSRSTTLQVQAELARAREVHAASIEKLRLEHEVDRDSWMHRAEEKFMKRVKKLASRVASQEQELIELRGAIASLRTLSTTVPGGSELALRIVEDALNVDVHQQHHEIQPTAHSLQQSQQNSAFGSKRPSLQRNIYNNNNTDINSRTGSQQQQQQQQQEVTPDRKVSGTRRLFETGVLDAESATVKRLIEKGYLSPP